MLCKVFYFDGIEVPKPAMQRDIGIVNAPYLHAFQQFSAEMKACCRSRYRPFMLGKNGLEVDQIGCGCMRFLAIINHITRQRSLSQCEEFAFELIVVAVVKEPKCAAAAGGIVDNFGHHRPRFVEEQFVTDADFAGRLHENVPQTHLRVQLSEQEHLDFCIGLLLCSIETRRKNLCIIEDKGVAFIKII